MTVKQLIKELKDFEKKQRKHRKINYKIKKDFDVYIQASLEGYVYGFNIKDIGIDADDSIVINANREI